jgi:hypothetical protein
MEKCDSSLMRSWPWGFVDQTGSLAGEFLDLTVDVIHFKTEMMDPRPLCFEKLHQGGILGGRLNEFDTGSRVRPSLSW